MGKLNNWRDFADGDGKRIYIPIPESRPGCISLVEFCIIFLFLLFLLTFR